MSTIYPDYNKTGFNDKSLCWGVCAANALWYTGWGPVLNIASLNDMFYLFKNLFPYGVRDQTWYVGAAIEQLLLERGATPEDVAACVQKHSAAEFSQIVSYLQRGGAGVAHLYRVNEATNETELAHYITVYEVILNTNFSHRDPRYISGFRYTDGDDGIVKDKQSLISYGPKYKEYVTQYNGDDAKIDYWYSILPPPLR